MAEEILYCPQCNNKLRIATEMLGDVVQCPLCNLVFATPRPGGFPGPAAVEDTQQQARAALQGPATGLVVSGVLGVLANLFQAGLALFFPEQIVNNEALLRLLNAEAEPEMVIQSAIMGGIAFGLLSGLVILTAVQIMRLRWHSLCLGGCFAAILNIGNFCCLLSAPFGIWAFVVLVRPEVREAFNSEVAR